MARRRPISLVRSVTLTSMMFMMPMPPTSRLTAATAPSSMVSTLVVPESVSASCLVSSTLKLSSSVSASLRRSRSNWVMLALTRVLSLPSAMDTSKSLTWVLPVMRRCRVLIGHEDQVVLVVAERALAFGAEHGDHLAADLLHAQRFAQRGAVAKQFAAHGFADHADRRAGAQFVVW